ncbi:unnamed protein product [Amoebophrya sp. A120]|nr:unnamed protein product [Amoebophrya sp. A120]|eukprot:GSA120T00018647001.1
MAATTTVHRTSSRDLSRTSTMEMRDLLNTEFEPERIFTAGEGTDKQIEKLEKKQDAYMQKLEDLGITDVPKEEVLLTGEKILFGDDDEIQLPEKQGIEAEKEKKRKEAELQFPTTRVVDINEADYEDLSEEPRFRKPPVINYLNKQRDVALPPTSKAFSSAPKFWVNDDVSDPFDAFIAARTVETKEKISFEDWKIQRAQKQDDDLKEAARREVQMEREAAAIAKDEEGGYGDIKFPANAAMMVDSEYKQDAMLRFLYSKIVIQQRRW